MPWLGISIGNPPNAGNMKTSRARLSHEVIIGRGRHGLALGGWFIGPTDEADIDINEFQLQIGENDVPP